jgi:hypothetical protein
MGVGRAADVSWWPHACRAPALAGSHGNHFIRSAGARTSLRHENNDVRDPSALSRLYRAPSRYSHSLDPAPSRPARSSLCRQNLMTSNVLYKSKSPIRQLRMLGRRTSHPPARIKKQQHSANCAQPRNACESERICDRKSGMIPFPFHS